MILLQLSDFDTYNSIAQSAATNPTLQEYIDRFEASYIKKILGVELGDLFIADIKGEDSDSSTIEPRFQVIIDGFTKQNSCCYIMESKGIRDVLAALVFFEYVSKTQVKHSQAGVITNDAEVSNIANPEGAVRFAESKWNEALESICAIQWWCNCEDEANYPEYCGMYFRPRYSALL